MIRGSSHSDESWDFDDFVLFHISKKPVMIYWEEDPIYDTESCILIERNRHMKEEEILVFDSSHSDKVLGFG